MQPLCRCLGVLLLIASFTLPAQSLGHQPPATDRVWLETVTEPAQPYVQAQLLYTLRLLHLDTLLHVSIQDPAITQATVYRLGNDKKYRTRRAGRDYGVLERRYAIFSEVSGVLQIPAVSVDCRITRHDPDNTAATPNHLHFHHLYFRLRSDAKTLTVRPRPPADRHGGGHWLPASRLSLSAVWPAAATARAGEPLTYLLRIEARGLRDWQLPEIILPVPAGARSYASVPVARMLFDQRGVLSRLEQPVTLIPAAAGQLTLPQLTLPWWSTDGDGQPRIAILPERRISVLAAAADLPPAAEPQPAPARQSWWRYAAWLLLVLWVLALLGWWREYQFRPKLLRN